MKNSPQRQILKILYNAGFHFTVTTNSITVLPSENDEDKDDKITFIFDPYDEDLINIDTHRKND